MYFTPTIDSVPGYPPFQIFLFPDLLHTNLLSLSSLDPMIDLIIMTLPFPLFQRNVISSDAYLIFALNETLPLPPVARGFFNVQRIFV